MIAKYDITSTKMYTNTSYFLKLTVFLFLLRCSLQNNEDFCDLEEKDCDSTQTRYIFYDVNPPEGFNLRRDVYMRYAVWMNALQRKGNKAFVKLVLPPWSHLYHWKFSIDPEFIPWSYYFDIESMEKFAPVIEMHQFFKEIGAKYAGITIDEVYVLQHYQDMFKTGKFVEKMSIETCDKPIRTNYFYYNNITSRNVRCLSFHGFTSQLSSILESSKAKTIYFDHAEVALHDYFGDKAYWKCRRSMRFNKELVDIANKFRTKYLNSSDDSDNTLKPEDWRQEKLRRDAFGGPYLSIHLRRGDFVRIGRVPSIKESVAQITEKLMELNLNAVFVATDAAEDEMNELKSLFMTSKYNLFLYEPTEDFIDKYKDGGVAIIEQIICAHARYFIGSHESTFSFRIQEEREILGFPVETTFNSLCAKKKKCEKPSKWQIVY